LYILCHSQSKRPYEIKESEEEWQKTNFSSQGCCFKEKGSDSKIAGTRKLKKGD
jgi:hypothetical protein